MADSLRVLGLCGSLRKGSYNRMALIAAEALAPAGMRISSYDLRPIPPYDEDERARGYPPEVAALRTRAALSDAVLFVTPEYNYSVPGVLKNAIDWVSRPPDPPFDGKPCAIMGASPGAIGTARAQYHLRQICVFLNMFPLNRPEVMIAHADERFDAGGDLIDEQTRTSIAKLLLALRDWTRRLKGM